MQSCKLQGVISTDVLNLMARWEVLTKTEMNLCRDEILHCIPKLYLSTFGVHRRNADYFLLAEDNFIEATTFWYISYTSFGGVIYENQIPMTLGELIDEDLDLVENKDKTMLILVLKE